VHEYDTALKALLQGSENSIFEKITGVPTGRGRWLNVELPEVQQTRVDLLFETLEPPRRLIGLELRSANDLSLPLQMAEYSLRVYRIQKQFPEQYVLYVGDPEMKMASELAGPNHVCRYTIIDIRSFDEEILLNSPFAADNVLAILARHKNRRETIRRILGRIAILEGGARYDAFATLLIVAGLRELESSIHTEVSHMPILNDIMDHKVLGPAIRKGLEQGRKEGKEEGKREEGLAILRKQVTKRFGRLPEWAEERLAAMSIAELEDLSVAVLDAKILAELFDR
jgi:predicted transposase YdaD